MGELEAKLKYEQDKFKTYNKDLKEAEKRYHATAMQSMHSTQLET